MRACRPSPLASPTLRLGHACPSLTRPVRVPRERGTLTDLCPQCAICKSGRLSIQIARTAALLVRLAVFFVMATRAAALEPDGGASFTNSALNAPFTLDQSKPGIWEHEIGQGFRSSVEHVGVAAGAGFGMVIFGSSSTHDIALAGISYGHMLGGVKGEGTFWRGNFEARLEVFGGSQYYPYYRFVAGFAPHLRYNLATGSRWIPFVDLGAGATLTDIDHLDLGGHFQFNLQACLGVNYFIRDNLACSVEYRYLHLSSARTSTPNLGVNSGLFMAGINWFF